ncbi:hypothetical protein LCGC14_0386250 [marine sediment metagenome]|uniref:Uncharacterized protein n=1 Tax=marine sediment metagenome TaxID=412755 RepID=A0A0F9VN28_9ZZZZ
MERQAPEKPPENKHSPTPWKAEDRTQTYLLDAGDKRVAFTMLNSEFDLERAQANRDLILDAVNGQKALEEELAEIKDQIREKLFINRGLAETVKALQTALDSNEQILTRVSSSRERLKEELSKVKAQRDELVAACEVISDVFPEITESPIGSGLEGTYLSPAGTMMPSQHIVALRQALDKIKEGLDTETIYKTKGG